MSVPSTSRAPFASARSAAGAVALAVSALLAGCAGDALRHAPACTGSEVPATRLFLQQVAATSAIVRWRGDAAALCAGTAADRLYIRAQVSDDGGHRQAVLRGLEPDTVYYYSLGGAGRAPAGQWFRTAPRPGAVSADGNAHIWILGDSGTETETFMGRATHRGEARAVMEGFLTYNRAQAQDEPVDLLLLLGDNAYLEGSDAQWQGAFFDVYGDLLHRTATWPTIGNHEMGATVIDVCPLFPAPGCDKGPLRIPLGGSSESADPRSYDSDGDGPDPGGLPYLQIFSLPTGGEAGGVPSGTEQYYSFDYGNVHVVSLDSQLSNRDPAQRAAMRDWLVEDLGANRRDWTVVVFHHPSYSKGMNHDSDVEQAEIDMRTTFGPVFERHGVDVVFSGHSHSYERSWYLRGHFGLSTSFDAREHAALEADGAPALGQGARPYRQLDPASGADDRVVYAVAGSAGKADTAKPCRPGQRLMCSDDSWLAHPAHRSFAPGVPGARPNGLAVKGSVVLDAGAGTLRARFVDEHGQVLDEFTITRD